MTTTAAAAEAAMPVVLIVSVEEAKRNAGKLWHHLAAGATVRVDDIRSGQTVGWLSAEPPAAVADVVAYLPEPGAAADRLGPDE